MSTAGTVVGGAVWISNYLNAVQSLEWLWQKVSALFKLPSSSPEVASVNNTKKEVHKLLQKELAELKVQNQKLIEDNAKTHQELAEVKEDNVKTHKEIAKVKEDNVKTHKEIAKVKEDNVKTHQELSEVRSDLKQSKEDNVKTHQELAGINNAIKSMMRLMQKGLT
jgi:chromosome segregation ATPase